ncbi:hypothetical protein LAZ67_X001948 [Cordylochernes scorpioides]|uniref:Uncharacterized protein n=1 Tax=Cordylochernes scorpioides TaxID=51811 RepID=A0ABY6LTF2_9ARAC|nr:hypothetical protein LAZ67_X001948 [Cordylochernes scorpioides]
MVIPDTEDDALLKAVIFHHLICGELLLKLTIARLCLIILSSFINKGTDQAVFLITQFQSGRYISFAEAGWRILGFSFHERPNLYISLNFEFAYLGIEQPIQHFLELSFDLNNKSF